jgi:hypothetical protein
LVDNVGAENRSRFTPLAGELIGLTTLGVKEFLAERGAKNSEAGTASGLLEYTLIDFI